MVQSDLKNCLGKRGEESCTSLIFAADANRSTAKAF